jgi:hypothetical protein
MRQLAERASPESARASELSKRVRTRNAIEKALAPRRLVGLCVCLMTLGARARAEDADIGGDGAEPFSTSETSNRMPLAMLALGHAPGVSPSNRVQRNARAALPRPRFASATVRRAPDERGFSSSAILPLTLAAGAGRGISRRPAPTRRDARRRARTRQLRNQDSADSKRATE